MIRPLTRLFMEGWPHLPRRWRPLEILACPHCRRLFRTTPAVLGKKIRCRGCREIFHVPRDTSSVPLGPAVVSVSSHDESLPVAIVCVADGRDARRCPACSREFLMKPAFAGKTIRCRGCKAPFRVKATPPADRPPSAPAETNPECSPQRSVSLPVSPRATAAPEEAAAPANPRPMIFEDIGDVLEDLRPGERIASVIRPKNAAALARRNAEALASVIAIVFGGVCGLVLTQLILWWVMGKDPFGIAPSLPGFLRWMAPQHFPR